MTRVLVIGDVGGHADQLRAALAAAGVAGRIPAGLTVVQVGDLVDRGPDSPGVLRLVRRYLDEQPDRWIQLAGNHESQYLPGGTAFWPERLAAADADLLRTWWADGRLQVAAALRSSTSDDFLITHAGLTVGAWRALGSPDSAGLAARLLNDRPPLLWSDNLAAVNRDAGPFWAEAGWELHEPWLEYRGMVPFGQIHGHSALVRYQDQAWRCPGRVRQKSTVDWSARHTRTRVGGRLFIAVDPKHGRAGAPSWRPLELTDAEVLGQPVPS
jgi:hypothetical protein